MWLHSLKSSQTYMNISTRAMETQRGIVCCKNQLIFQSTSYYFAAFSVNQPAYDKIPDDLPIRKPYPLPSPAPPPPPDIRYARAIPPEVNERIANRLIASVGAPEPQAGPFMIPHSPSSDSPRQLTTSPTCDGKGKAKEIISVPSDQEVLPCYILSHNVLISRFS